MAGAGAGAVAVLAVLVIYVAAFRATWIDDAYIQRRYARTLIDPGTWGFYPGYPANTATFPLNVLLLAWEEGFPFGEAPVNRKLATSSLYRGAGLGLRENLPPKAGVAVHGEIETVSLFAG